MSILDRLLGWAYLLTLFFLIGMCTRSQYKHMDNMDSANAQLTTDLNKIQREIEWERDNLNKQIMDLQHKANKYDSIMEYEKKASNIRK